MKKAIIAAFIVLIVIGLAQAKTYTTSNIKTSKPLTNQVGNVGMDHTYWLNGFNGAPIAKGTIQFTPTKAAPKKAVSKYVTESKPLPCWPCSIGTLRKTFRKGISVPDLKDQRSKYVR